MTHRSHGGGIAEKWKALPKFDKLLIILIIAAILLRLFSVFTRDIISDGAIYVAYGDAIVHNGDIYLKWGQIWPFGVNHPPGYSHWFPPLYPAYLALWIWAFGLSPNIIKIANFTLSIVALVIIYFFTLDLYDRRKALLVTAAMGFQPILIMAAAHSMSENMVMITYVSTVWALLRGFKDGRYLIIGGFLAGLTYLSRSNVGYLFIVIGLVGFAWRFYLDKWALFKNKYYITAALIFGIMFLGWTYRNILHFGIDGWETNPIITEMFISAWNHPPETGEALVYQVIASSIMLLPIAGFWGPEIAVALKRAKEEYFGGLIIATFLPFLITYLFMASCWVWAVKDMGLPPDLQPPAIWLAGVRYLVITNVPLLWLVFATARFSPDEKPMWWDTQEDRNRPDLKPLKKWYSRFEKTGGMERMKMLLKSPRWVSIFVISLVLAVISILFADPVHGTLIIISTASFIAIRGSKRKMTILITGFMLATVLVASDPIHEGYIQATERANQLMEDGDNMSIDGGNTSIYIFYPYIEHREQPVYYYHDGINTTFIVSFSNRTYDGYYNIGVYRTYHVLGFDLPPYQDSTTVWLWEKEEHFRARNGSFSEIPR